LTHAKLLGVALRILRDRALAEDVLQESYLKIWRHAASYDPAIASPMTWMATIVRHGAIDTLRKRQIEVFASDDAMSALPSNDPDPVERDASGAAAPEGAGGVCGPARRQAPPDHAGVSQGPQPP
jgi:RNA polymerase sigma-70 factor (ECF subfamily)